MNGGLLVDYQYTESFGYDKIGNIRSLSRFNINQEHDLDHLIFTYNGNQITKITDGFLSHNINGLKEYQDKANQPVEFLYDKNGNMTTDLDRDIVTIRYNLLNLPDTVQFKYGNRIVNKYDAAGRKLATEYHTLVTPLTVPLTNGQTLNNSSYAGTVRYSGTSYVDNFEYGFIPYKPTLYYALARVYNADGYVLYFSREENYFAYFRRDHLGSIREVWLAVDQGQTIQRTQYYPSGLPWDKNMGGIEQPYRYNGKEWIETHGYDMYDYHARGYYPAVMRFNSIDPLAEKRPWESPYCYAGNNPIRYIDPDGREVRGITKQDAQNFRDDIHKVLADDKFANVRALIDVKGKTFKSIDANALSSAMDGVTLTGDESAYITMITGAINSKDVHKVEYVSGDFTSAEGAEAFVNHMNNTLGNGMGDKMVTPDGKLSSAWVSNSGEGLNVPTKNGSHSFIGGKLQGDERAVTSGHEVFGHGIPAARKLTPAENNANAIRTDNLIRRLLGLPQRDGSNHGGYQEGHITTPYILPITK